MTTRMGGNNLPWGVMTRPGVACGQGGWFLGQWGLAFTPPALLCHLPPFFPSLWIFLVASWAGSAAPGLTRRPPLAPPALTQLRCSFYFRGF